MSPLTAPARTDLRQDPDTKASSQVVRRPRVLQGFTCSRTLKPVENEIQ